MRRRSERKKSVEASPVASSRRSSRRTRRTSDIEKNDEPEQHHDETPTKTDSSPNRASSEERVESTRRGKATRNSRTPAKRILRKLSGTDKQIDCIEEEENGVAHQVEQKIVEEEEVVVESTTTVVNEQEVQSNHESSEQVEVKRATDDAGEVNEITSNVEQREPLTVQADDNEATGEEKDVGIDDTRACEPKLNFSNEDQNITEVLITGTKTNQVEVDKKDVEKEAMPTIDETETHEDKMEMETESENLEKSHPQEHAEDKKEEIPIDEESDKLKNVDAKDHFPNEEKSNGPQEIEVDVKKPNSVKPTEEAQLNNNNDSKVSAEPPRSRKRKWLSKKPTDGKDQIMAISTDSLKNLIADVQPVPLSDVQLESSSEVEEVASERDDIVRDSNSNSPTDSEPRRNIIEPKVADKLNKSADNAVAVCQSVPKAVMPVLHDSPSPPRNNTSNVLYITNLVRPFTIMQLKGLLARTGKIVENGFWIDRIKSKCYVQYETEDEAIETRHALHGVRWPVSNPKCLNVDFGNYVDMERAIKTTADDGPKYGQDFKENFNAGTGWNREPQETQEDKKNSKPIREWDVGKKESREKREMEKREQRSPKEAEEDKFKKNRGRQRAGRSSSLSPARKVKKEEPPLRLLDDLFRKTKAAPCIYWLPLTPEQIAGKEAFRQKRIEERQERIKLRELQREKEHELDRGRDRDRSRERVKSRDRERSRERDRDRRRNRSNERRRSRSRDRRRY